VKVLLVSTYELGRQPFGLASPAAWLRAEGHEVACADLACGPLPVEPAAAAGLAAFYLPMHTATRLATRAMARVQAVNPRAHLCAYGLYAPVNERMLRAQGVATVLGGEFEEGLAALARRLEAGVDGAQREPLVSLDRLQFRVPDRSGLPPLDAYARLVDGGAVRRTGYTEASRGCKHLCRHCPIVPVYNGAFRVVQREVVLADIRQQVAAGAEHITFGDPDFFNGPGHAMAVVEGLHAEFPRLTYDVTIKVEHLRKHRDLLPRLARTGCRLVTSAVESIDDAVLEKLAKGHTRADFCEAVGLARQAGLALAPTFVAFTPWTTRESYRELLRAIAELDLVEHVAPIQLAIRLLIPAGSKLLDLEEVRGLVQPFDAAALVYPWRHPDPGMDRLSRAIQDMLKAAGAASRADLFRRICAMAGEPLPADEPRVARAAIPYLTEPWYC
jgi:hypothetical protein